MEETEWTAVNLGPKKNLYQVEKQVWDLKVGRGRDASRSQPLMKCGKLKIKKNGGRETSA